MQIAKCSPIALTKLPLLGAFLIMSASSFAAEWTTSKEIALGGVYTDNLFLTEREKEGAWVALVTPGIDLRGTGRRLDLRLAYAPQVVKYFSGIADDKFYNRLQFDATSELVEDHFFLDARATAGQGLIDVFGPSGGDIVNVTGNVQTVYTYAIAPEFRNRFKKGAEFFGRYENYGVFYSDDGDNAIGNLVDVSLFSGPELAKTRVGAVFSGEYINYEDDRSKRLKNIGVVGAYAFDSHWRADAYFGYEDNDIDAVRTDTSGSRWGVSGTWTPNSRTLLTLGIGKRFFGWTPLMNFSHRSKRSLWTASYRRDLSSAAQEQAQSDVFEFEDALGAPNQDPITGEPADIPPGAALPSAASFVSDRFLTGYQLETRRSKIGIDAAYIQRQYEDSSRDYSTAWTGVSWNRRLSPVTTSDLRLRWYWNREDDETSTGANEYTDWTLTAGIRRKLTERTEVGAWYRFRNRNGNRDQGNYQENRFNIAIRTVWAN